MKLSRWFNYLYPAVVLGFCGVVLLHGIYTGRWQGLVAASFRPWVATAGAGLLLFALAYLTAYQPSEMDQGLSWSEGAKRLTLLFALVGVALSAPAAYSTRVILNRAQDDWNQPLNLSDPGSGINEAPSREFESKDGEAQSVEINELLATAQDAAMQAAWDGKKVRVIGQWIQQKAGAGRLARLMMFCCAADAQSVSVVVRGPVEAYRNGEWLEITGLVKFEQSLGQAVVVIEAQATRRTATPQDPYLY